MFKTYHCNTGKVIDIKGTVTLTCPSCKTLVVKPDRVLRRAEHRRTIKFSLAHSGLTKLS